MTTPLQQLVSALLSPEIEAARRQREEAQIAAYVASLDRKFRDEHEAILRQRGSIAATEAGRAGTQAYVDRRMGEILRSLQK